MINNVPGILPPELLINTRTRTKLNYTSWNWLGSKARPFTLLPKPEEQPDHRQRPYPNAPRDNITPFLNPHSDDMRFAFALVFYISFYSTSLWRTYTSY